MGAMRLAEHQNQNAQPRFNQSEAGLTVAKN